MISNKVNKNLYNLNRGDIVKKDLPRVFANKIEKEVIIAHFLRFVHPINYMLTPAKKKHSSVCSDIGEYPILIN